MQFILRVNTHAGQILSLGHYVRAYCSTSPPPPQVLLSQGAFFTYTIACREEPIYYIHLYHGCNILTNQIAL